MREANDIQLLRQFVESELENAFATLVQRQINLVYSAALRYSGNRHAAEEISQAVFIILARKARTLLGHKILSGWLYQTTRLTAANYVRAESRRARREQEAQSLMNDSTSDAREAWEQIAPLLENAMGALKDKERSAIVLRYFENKSFRDVALALDTTEDAAKMRVTRAVEKLRSFFGKRGITLSAAAIITALSTRSIQAAPGGLVAAVISKTANVASPAGSVLASVKGTLALLAWAKLRVPLGLTAATLVIGGVIATVMLLERQPPTIESVAGISTPSRDTAPVPPREPFAEGTLLTLNSPVGSVALQRDGKILVAATLGGFFVDEQSGTLGWYTRGAMRFETDGTLDRTFYCDVGRPGSSSAMAAQLSVLDDGRIFMSGIFDSVDAQPRHGHAIVLPDGRVDESFNPWRAITNISPRIDFSRLSFSSIVLNDGSIAVMSRPVGEPGFPGKSWEVYGLDPSGTIVFPELTNSPLDAFRPPKLILSYSDIPLGPFPEVPLEMVRYAVRLPDGSAILAVRDRPIDGIMRYGSLKRFDKNWSPDPNFTNEFAIHATSEISLHLQSDGKLLVAGMIGKLNGEDFPGLVRLDATGAIDRSFRCETENSLAGRVMDLAIQEDGRIVICGFFTRVNGVPRQHIARLNSDGSLDESFRAPFVSIEELHRKRAVRVHRIAKTSIEAEPVSTPDSVPSPPDTVVINSLRMVNDIAVVQFSGKPHEIYILQANESMRSDNWTNVSTNQASASGAGTLRDVEAKAYPMRFYRIASP